ncbi:peptide chain release factor 1, mitochondrial isoform X1 [Hyla sarda]|uniref:peptide chain release factor 1, mitochondrial isoform X1 n=1 Tax=Hyla sarda TaxID=327740 RepID=UPI0024C27FA1|nr:peptide chain release factor 1, mitochondrial isoform X1 [Hyla sarda]
MKRFSVVALWRIHVSALHTCPPRYILQRLCTKPFTEQLSVGSQHRVNTFPFTSLYGLHFRRSCSQGFGALWQNKTLQNYLQSLMSEHRELSQALNLTLKEEERKALTSWHTELSSLHVLLHNIQEAENEVRELEAIFADLNSKEEEELLLEEKNSMIQNINSLKEELLRSLVPQEKYDLNDAVLEVVSGRTTGGDICQQFTAEVFDMYRNYAQYKSWSFEILNYTPNDSGGLHHAAARVIGDGAYRRLKYEGGIHRVQRIPEVGLSSRMQRIHTGTMTVIVLPQPDEVDVKIDPKDLRIDTFKAKGAGGQHVNTTDSAVRIVHIPTGISVECQQERSQIQNRDKAMKMLRAKLHEQNVKKELSLRQSSRKLQVGTRDQSDRIRTYNFTQDRLTDHRISYEIRNLREFLSGEELLDELIDKIQAAADTEALLEVIKRHSSRGTNV